MKINEIVLAGNQIRVHLTRMTNNTTNQIVLMTRSETMVAKIFPTMSQTMDQAVQSFCEQQEIELLQWFYDWNNA